MSVSVSCNLTCSAAGADKVNVKLNFARKELLYDIKNYAYIEGHVMGEENQHGQHVLVDIGEEGTVDRVTRVLNVVHAAAVELLFPFTKEPAMAEEVNDVLTEPENYVIDLTVPSTFSRTTVHLLARLVHEYMVYTVLYDWLGTAHPKAAENWLMKAKEAEQEIGRLKNRRGMAFERPLSPF